MIGGVAGFMAGGAYALANDKNPVTGALIGAAGGVLLGGLIGDLNFGGTGSAAVGGIKSAIPGMAVQGINFAAKLIDQRTTNQYAQLVGYRYSLQQVITVDNTNEALEHYFNGHGEPVNIGIKTTFSLLTSPEFKLHESRIVSGLIDKSYMRGYFSINMTKRVFHIGNTNVGYSINCSSQNCAVTFSLFIRDGFWDVDFIDENTLGAIKRNRIPLFKQFQPDGMGPNLERLGGHPYPYNPVIIKFNFINPGYSPK